MTPCITIGSGPTLWVYVDLFMISPMRSGPVSCTNVAKCVRWKSLGFLGYLVAFVREGLMPTSNKDEWLMSTGREYFFTLWKFGETQELRTCFLMELCELISVKQLKSSLIGWELSRNYSTHFRYFLWSVNLFQCILRFRSLGACEQRGETLCCF